jgi:hypothetical protein
MQDLGQELEMPLASVAQSRHGAFASAVSSWPLQQSYGRHSSDIVFDDPKFNNRLRFAPTRPARKRNALLLAAQPERWTRNGN